MSRDLKKRVKQEKGCDVTENIVVAVKASKEIPKSALVWALTHVVKPGDCIVFLVVANSQNSGRKLWSFPRLTGDCASIHRRSQSAASADRKSDLTYSCSQMILQLQDVYNPNEVNVKINIVPRTPCGAVAADAKRNNVNWVVLDKHLEHEEKRCMEELHCNIVVIKRSQPKILRLNLVGSPKRENELTTNSAKDQSSKKQVNNNDPLGSTRGPLVTPSSSPETFTATEAGTSSVSSSDLGTSPFFITAVKDVLKKEDLSKQDLDNDDSGSETETEYLSSSSSLRFQPPFEHLGESSRRTHNRSLSSGTSILLEKLIKLDDQVRFGSPRYLSNQDPSGSLREVISTFKSTPPGPPPLCSICQHKAPVFGKPPRWFTYAELELATGGFSRANFLAEGGFGSVYQGVLPDGQAIAVKQHKLASSQGDQEFCSEVEVLSCAQHRNVVMLIGFCIEDGRRLLVYEYICNGSLDSYLYGRHPDTLTWSARQRIAVGAARGLRYLHEECRVGCIVHRDMRPNNILITHDFEPLVGDFGLARWQPDGETGVETRVIGTFGYLAPEYAQSGQVTEKADVYSFGVVLMELVTGRKAIDINRPKGQQCLTEWARPLLEAHAVDELIDPRLGSQYLENEVYCMLHAASLCISRDPLERPRMSQVLRILECEVIGSNQRSPSGKMWSDHRIQNKQHIDLNVNKTSQHFNSKLPVNSRSKIQ